MKYHAPYGSTDPNASYVDKNVPGAVRGSAVPAAAIETPQREIVNLQTKSGLAEANTLQLASAVQSGLVNYAVAGGTGAAITAALDPAPADYTKLKRLTLKTSAAVILDGATLNLNALGALPILKVRGAPIRKGDIPQNTTVELLCDGTSFVFTGLALSEVPSLAIGDVTFYVRPDGNDGNSGLSNTIGGAFRQVQAAIDAVSRYVMSGYVAYIQVADGTYNAFVARNTGGSDIQIVGNVASPGNVIIDGGALDAIRAINNSTISVKGMRINAPAAGKSCLLAFDRSNIVFSDVVFGPAGLSHIYASGSALVRAIGNYSIAAGSQNHILAGTTSVADIAGRTATITTAMSFTQFAQANNGTILAAGAGFPGAGGVTGSRYLTQVVGVIYTGGGGANFFAGSTAGTFATNGIYI